MRKLFLATAMVLLFATPVFASSHGGGGGSDGGGAGMQRDRGSTGPSCGCTRVQQLYAKLKYQQNALAQNPYHSYYGPASKRTAKQLAAAKAAAAAGTPMPPMKKENGDEISPSHWSLY